MKIIVVGAGIAGLSTARAMLARGMEVVIVEQAAGLKEIGAGIQLAANGILVLRDLGLEPAIAAVASRPQSYNFRELETGEMLFGNPLGKLAEERYGAPMFQIYRPDLLGILSRGLPEGVLRLQAGCVAVEQGADAACVRLASGETIDADAVIGADGIHSAVRRHLRGQESTQFASILMWRAMIPGERLTPLNLDERGHYWVGPGRTVITYWVRPGTLFNFLGSVPASEVHRESWTDSGDVDDMRRSFDGAEPVVRHMLDSIDTAFITGMFYHHPVDRWTEGRITLIGDAAHAMVPFLAQGACQAIEDAWTLAACLDRHGRGGVPAALLEYEQRRRPRTTRVQAAAREMVKLVHETDPVAIRARNGRWKGVSRIDPLAETTWGWLFDHDVRRAIGSSIDEVVGLSAAREGKRMRRPEAQRAYDLWKHAFTAEDVARGQAGLRAGYDRFLRETFPPPADTAITGDALGGVPVVRVEPAGATDGPTILHFHGGGYVIGSAATSVDLAARLARAVRGGAISVDYRLAPEHPFPAALDDALGVYRALVANGVSPKRILISGESSGGGLAIAATLALREAGDPLPAGVVALSPFADLTVSGETIDSNAGNDPAANRINLTTFAGSYFQGADPTDPRVSPLFGDFRGFPPLLLAATAEEVLRSDSTRLADRAREAGVDVALTLAPDSVHVFPLFAFLPETEETMRALAAFSSRVAAAS